ncbi:MAG: preprotein translocase subunit SecE [Proteobacteria bacterium]|nr:preprotein translocase subunit SecE [Pseudomonadota bacterium]MCL2307909.1 preprotein translocase subunit SecE [Pseudomonadota bacterium]
MTLADRIKIIVAIACVVLGLWGYYNYVHMSGGLRALMIFGGIVAGAVVFWLSSPGKEFVVFAREAWQEGARVAWPSRQETVKMTLIVFAFVVVMALFLFFIDQIIAWLIKLFMGTGGA